MLPYAVLSLLADVKESDLPSPSEPLPDSRDINRKGHHDLPFASFRRREEHEEVLA